MMILTIYHSDNTSRYKTYITGYSPPQYDDLGSARTFCWVPPLLTAGGYVVVGAIWGFSVPLPQKKIPAIIFI